MTGLKVIALLAALLSLPLAHANALKGHPSPYLAMHGDDPVDWHLWGPGVLEEAQETHRLIFVSSGYFACHWCHVMHRESYQDPKVAAVLNRFVPVKVDRELSPALDALLIAFVERTRGAAGWPLHVILTPEGHPLIGFTYLPRERLVHVLSTLLDLWREDPERLTELARQTSERLKQAALQPPPPAKVPPREAFRRAALALADELAGGFGHQMKFPRVPQLEALLALFPEDREVKRFITLTLDQMASEGLRDHIGGGFFRYTTDPNWQRPHFEKMLYDNALLARLYLKAAKAYGREDYAAIAFETLTFMEREMKKGRLFISSLSAVDARGVEGGYYLWDKDELKALLSDAEYQAAARAWGLHGPPPFAGGYLPIPHEKAPEALLERARHKLFEARRKRRLPRDEKALAGWNALALSALRLAAERDPAWGEKARDLAEAILEAFWDGEKLRRLPKGGLAVPATLEDHAYLLEALGGKGFGGNVPRGTWLSQAWSRFYRGGWFLAEERLLPFAAPQPMLEDGPLPSPSAVLIRASLGTPWEERANAALRAALPWIASRPFAYASAIPLL